MMSETNVYQEHGFESRQAYLINLADENGVSRSEVMAMASVLGPSEDFDGLVTSIEDMS